MTKHHKNKRGGQPKPQEDKAVYRVGVNLTHDEHAKVEQLASTFKVSKSEVLRRTLVRTRINPPLSLDQKKLAADIGRLGHNMNQVARRLNTLHARIDVAEKHRVKHDVSMDEMLQIAQDAEATYKETVEKLRVIRAIVTDTWEGERGLTGGAQA